MSVIAFNVLSETLSFKDSNEVSSVDNAETKQQDKV